MDEEEIEVVCTVVELMDWAEHKEPTNLPKKVRDRLTKIYGEVDC